MRRPLPLPPGGTIGIVSPSSPVDIDRLHAGTATLERLGYRVRLAPNALETRSHCVQSDTRRASDFASFYADPAIDIIWCSRGGASSCRLWPLLDWQYLSTLSPKWVIGYSDITSILLPMTQIVGVMAMHGPVVTDLADIAPQALTWLLRLLNDPLCAGNIPGRAAETLVAGTAEGRLCGGCLSLIAAAVGTAYQIDAAHKLLFLEDINEAPHRIERYLVQLREAGILDAATGFVIGEATKADNTTNVMRTIWNDLLQPYGKPAVIGFPAGHVLPNYALPMGASGCLYADECRIALL